MFDVTNQATLQHLPAWMQIVNENAPNIPILVIGTKIDLVSMRNVARAEAIQMAKSTNLAGYAEVSAKTGANVENVFESIAKLMMKRSS